MSSTKSSLIGASQFLNSGLNLKLNAPQKKALGNGPKMVQLANVHKVLRDDKKITGLVGKLKIAKSPAAWAKVIIDAKWQSLKGARGFLGKATTPVNPCPDGEGFFQHFKGGSIYFHPNTGAHEVHGAIRAHWASLKWERGFLGYPETDELHGRDEKGKGRYSRFQNGTIYWHKTTGAHEVHGAILRKYHELGEEASFLGYPTTDERKTPAPRGRFNHFVGGSIYWTPQTGAHEVHGLIRKYWAQHGWERNDALGFPLTDELVPDRNAGRIRPSGRIVIAHAGIKLDPGKFALNQPVGIANNLAASIDPAILSTAAKPQAASAKPVKKASVKKSISGATTMTLDAQSVQANAIRNVAGVRAVSQEANVGTSPNRFNDFENGLVFWHRGGKAAVEIKPWTRTKKGQSMALSRNQVLAKVSNSVKQIIKGLPNGLKLQSIGMEANTSEYRYDGIRPLNREHRIRIKLTGQIRSQNKWVNTTLELRLNLLVEHDPFTDRMVASFTRFRWIRYRKTVRFIENVDFEAHKNIDSHLWKPFELLKIPKTDGGRLITVLSVKTQSNGRVEVFIEPEKVRIPVGQLRVPTKKIQPVTNAVLRNPRLVKQVTAKAKLIKPRH